MSGKQTSARLCRWAVMGVAALVVLLMPTAPWLAGLAAERHFFRQEAARAIVIAFYPCALCAMTALWQMYRLLGSILGGQVFIRGNVRRLKVIAVCCGLVALFCLPAGAYYLGLLFVSLIMGFLCLAVCVVGSLMSAATALREENDLTI